MVVGTLIKEEKLLTKIGGNFVDNLEEFSLSN